MSVVIKKGSDKKFIIKLRKASNDSGGCADPFDLTPITKITIKFKKCGDDFLIDTDEVAAQSATKSIIVGAVTIVFTADIAGINGNSIVLVFDGIDDIDTVVGAWNIANAGNTVSHDGVGTEVPTAQTVNLENAFAAYFNITILTPEVLGNIEVCLSNSDTEMLVVGEDQDIDVWLDEGDHPQGIRTKVCIEEAISVKC